MGRGGKRTWQHSEEGWQPSGHGSSWKLWDRAYASSPKSAQKDPLKLRYDQVNTGQDWWYSQPQTAEAEEDAITSELPAAFREVQKALTRAKKADSRVKRLRQDASRRKAQFEKYEGLMMQAFAKQRRQFDADIAQIEEDIQSATLAGQTAAQNVQLLAIYGQTTEAAQQEKEEAHADRVWDEMMQRSGDAEMGPDSGFGMPWRRQPVMPDKVFRGDRPPPASENGGHRGGTHIRRQGCLFVNQARCETGCGARRRGSLPSIWAPGLDSRGFDGSYDQSGTFPGHTQRPGGGCSCRGVRRRRFRTPRIRKDR